MSPSSLRAHIALPAPAGGALAHLVAEPSAVAARRTLRLALVLALAAAALGALLAAGEGFAGGTQPAGAIQPGGARVSAVEYVHGAAVGSLAAVRFQLDPAAARGVQVQLDLGGPWYACSNDAGAVTCPTLNPQARLADAGELTVRAAG